MFTEERVALGLGIVAGAVNAGRRVCPVCKSTCSVPTLVPIYVRSNEYSPRNRSSNNENRPSGEGLVSEVTASASIDSELDGNVDGTAAATGLRQRFRRHSQNGGDGNPSRNYDDVPSRPAAMSPQTSPPSSSPSTPPHQRQHQHHQYRSSTNPLWITPLSPTGHRASLTHGLLLSLQQAGLGPPSHSSVPPIHRQDGRGNATTGDASMNGSSELEVNPGATEYLSRLLIMLGSFVVLCLLLS